MSTQGKIKLSLSNAAGTAQVYLNQANDLTLGLTNQSGDALPLTGGQPQNPPPAGGAFAVVLDFSALYAVPADQQHLTITAAGWAAAYLGGDYPAWVLTPVQSLSWAANGTYQFALAGLVPTAALGTYYVAINLYNLDGLPPQPNQQLLGVANAPTGQKALGQALGTRLDSADVAITRWALEPCSTQLVLTLYNLSNSVPLVPNQPWPAQPKFTLSFVPDVAPPGFFALTTPDALNNLTVGTTKAGWSVVKTTSSPPQWVLAPTTNNRTILGTGTDALVQFTIGGLVTQFAAGPTLLYLQYNDIPGYDDGIITLVLNKEYPPMQLKSFAAGQTHFEVSNDTPLTTYLNWSVLNASYVELSGYGPVPAQQAAFPVPVLTDMAYVLTAYDLALGDVQTAVAALTVTPPLSKRWTPLGSIVAWAGEAASVPTGWVVCDGTQGAPDLRNFFVLGAGSTAPGQHEALPPHTHPLAGFAAQATTSAAGAHTHRMPTSWYARNLSCGVHTGIDTCGTFDVNTQYQGVGDHQHMLAVSFPGAATSANTLAPRPAWYALLYLMYHPTPPTVTA